MTAVTKDLTPPEAAQLLLRLHRAAERSADVLAEIAESRPADLAASCETAVELDLLTYDTLVDTLTSGVRRPGEQPVPLAARIEREAEMEAGR